MWSTSVCLRFEYGSEKMSFYHWLKHDKPSSSIDDAANKEVSKELGKSVSRKRGKYNHYDAEVKVKIAKYACENRNKFTRWYASEVQQALDREITLENIKVDLKASIIKPLHSNWMINSLSTLSDSNGLKKAFEKPGIIGFVNDCED